MGTIHSLKSTAPRAGLDPKGDFDRARAEMVRHWRRWIEIADPSHRDQDDEVVATEGQLRAFMTEGGL